VEHVGVVGVELPGDVVDVVAALGHGQRHDPGGLGGHLLDHRLRVVGRQQVLRDRADDARLVGAVAVLEHQRVQAVLGVEDLLHPPVERHDADAADRPVERFTLVHQTVVVHRLVRAVEPADTDVHDADGEAAAVIARRRHALRPRHQRACAQRRHRHNLRATRSAPPA
jgi:hypothetical protein